MNVDNDFACRCSLTKNILTWEHELAGDQNKESLLEGIADGFHLVPNITVIGNSKLPKRPNLAAKPLLDELFSEESRDGKISLQTKKLVRLHTIGAATKKGSNKLQPITDCSRPISDSLNLYMDVESFSFASIDDAIELSLKNCHYDIVNIKLTTTTGFSSTPLIARSCLERPGKKPRFFVDNFICFGLACALTIFHRLSPAIARMIRRRGYLVVCYLGDFLVIEKSYSACSEALMSLRHLLSLLGSCINWDKVISPSCRIRFWGFILGFLKEQVELSNEKLEDLKRLANLYMDRRKIRKVELQRLVGHISFASRAIHGARTFTRISVDALTPLKQPHHRTRVTKL